MKIKSDIANSVTADYIVTEVMGDTYDDAGILKEKYYRWLFRVWSRLNLSLIRTKREVILPIASGTQTMWLPPDYSDFIFIGYHDSCGNRIPITINRNLAPALGVENADICETCGNVDLCSLETQTTEEQVFINGVPYRKVTTRIINPDGSYIEEVTEPVAKYDLNGLVSIEPAVISSKVVCQLDKACDQCVPATPGNLNMLAGCGCTDAICCCSNDMLPYPVKPGTTHYNLFEQEGFIQFSKNNCLTSAILKYVSTGCVVNGIYYFPLACMETLISGTYFRSIEKKKNVPFIEKDRARKAYTGERKELLRDFTRLSYEEWRDMIDCIPRLPSL